MSEYSIEFAQQMAIAGNVLLEASAQSTDRDRAALYISLVACEVALKAALELAGKSIQDIRKKSHNLSSLLDMVASCKVIEEISPGNLDQVPATRIRGVVVDPNFSNATIGNLLSGESIGASKFPNEVRYGDVLEHYPVEVMVEAANKLVAWVKMHRNDIQP